MTQEEAHRRARLDLGGMEQTKEKCRDARGVNWIQDFWTDFRFAARELRKRPGFTLTAVLSLALGIGATSAVFSVIYAVLIDPFPYTGADRIVELRMVDKAGSDRHAINLSGTQADVLRQASGGVLAGVLLSVAFDKLATRWVSESSRDPVLLAGATLLLVVAAGLACFVPARRAASVDPMEALRCE